MDIIRYDHEDVDIKTEKRQGKYAVVWSRFHGGGVVSQHRSLRSALAFAHRINHGGCGCGCVGVIDAADYKRLPTATQAVSARDLARREV